MSIECSRLSSGYHNVPVLEEVCLSVGPGSVTALLGPNGSGKSTLLRAIGGMLPLLTGEVLVDGRPPHKLTAAERARTVAFVPQEEPMPFRFLVREVVAMGRIPHSTGIFETEEDLAAADRAMDVADCAELSGRPVTELSGGEKQRVLIARALAQEAPVLLLDEPTSHLDVAHQLAVAALVRRLAGEGRTIVAAVHDLNLASAIADHAVLLRSGRVAASGPVNQILESSELDRVFAASFERIALSNGRLGVYAVSG